MKRAGILFAALFAIMLLGQTAKADSTDPGVIVNKTDPEATVYDGLGPLMVPWSSTGFTMSFVYEADAANPDPAEQLDSLTVDLTGVPTADNLVFQCYSDIWVNCASGALFSTVSDGTVTYQFVFSDPTPGEGGTCNNSLPPALSCPGFLSLGDQFTASLVIPEPSTSTLLVLGLLSLLAFVTLGRSRGWRLSRPIA